MSMDTLRGIVQTSKIIKEKERNKAHVAKEMRDLRGN